MCPECCCREKLMNENALPPVHANLGLVVSHSKGCVKGHKYCPEACVIWPWHTRKANGDNTTIPLAPCSHAGVCVQAPAAVRHVLWQWHELQQSAEVRRAAMGDGQTHCGLLGLGLPGSL